MKERINHPQYYNSGCIECIDFIDANNLGFALGSAVKYIVRAGLKDGEPTIEALQKAIWYLDHEIQRLKTHELNAHLDAIGGTHHAS